MVDKNNPIAIVPKADRFCHEAACRVSDLALRVGNGKAVVVIDLKEVEDATTAAFARLVLLRQALRRSGGDLRLTGLRDRAAGLYEVNRLGAVLPMHERADSDDDGSQGAWEWIPLHCPAAGRDAHPPRRGITAPARKITEMALRALGAGLVLAMRPFCF